MALGGTYARHTALRKNSELIENNAILTQAAGQTLRLRVGQAPYYTWFRAPRRTAAALRRCTFYCYLQAFRRFCKAAAGTKVLQVAHFTSFRATRCLPNLSARCKNSSFPSCLKEINPRHCLCKNNEKENTLVFQFSEISKLWQRKPGDDWTGQSRKSSAEPRSF